MKITDKIAVGSATMGDTLYVNMRGLRGVEGVDDDGDPLGRLGRVDHCGDMSCRRVQQNCVQSVGGSTSEPAVAGSERRGGGGGS